MITYWLEKDHGMVHHGRCEKHLPGLHHHFLWRRIASRGTMVVLDLSHHHVTVMPVGLVIVVGPHRAFFGGNEDTAFHVLVHQRLDGAAGIHKGVRQGNDIGLPKKPGGVRPATAFGESPGAVMAAASNTPSYTMPTGTRLKARI